MTAPSALSRLARSVGHESVGQTIEGAVGRTVSAPSLVLPSPLELTPPCVLPLLWVPPRPKRTMVREASLGL